MHPSIHPSICQVKSNQIKSNQSSHKHILVGGFNPSEKYEFVSWDDSSQYHGKAIGHNPVMFQSPPTRYG